MGLGDGQIRTAGDSGWIAGAVIRAVHIAAADTVAVLVTIAAALLATVTVIWITG